MNPNVYSWGRQSLGEALFLLGGERSADFGHGLPVEGLGDKVASIRNLDTKLII